MFGSDFSFVLQQALSFRMRHHLCRQGGTLAGNQRLRPQGPMLVQAHFYRGENQARGARGSERERERVEDRREDGNGNEEDGNESGSGDGTRNGNGNESRRTSGQDNGDENGDETG